MRRDGSPNPEVFEILRSLVSELAGGQTISLPFVGKTLSFGADSGNLLEVAKALDSIKTLKASSAGARQSAKAYAEEMDRMLQVPRGEGPPPAEATRLAVGSTAVADLVPASAPASVAPPSSVSSRRSAGASNAAAAAAPARSQRPPNVTAFKKLGAPEMDRLLAEYGVDKQIGNRNAQYTALMGV
jgi:hypothetical protein